MFAYGNLYPGCSFGIGVVHAPDTRPDLEKIKCELHEGCALYLRSDYGNLLNHSPDPNCEFVTSKDGLRLYLHILKRIPHNHELLVDYGPDYTIQCHPNGAPPDAAGVPVEGQAHTMGTVFQAAAKGPWTAAPRTDLAALPWFPWWLRRRKAAAAGAGPPQDMSVPPP